MANYAFIDKERQRKIYASSDDIMQYKSVRCYCKNPLCDARMFVYDPEHKSLAFFKASGKPSHSGSCGIAPYHFAKTEYVEEKFFFPEGLFPLLQATKEKGQEHGGSGTHGTEETERRPLQGLKEIYSMLTNTDINDTYNGYLIKDMIADERTRSIYRNGITGYKVVECNFYKYMDASKSITMNYPCFPNKDFSLELWFDDEELYESMKKRIKGKKHDGIVIVFGNWVLNSLDGTNYVNISSQKQISVIKKESND